MHGQRPGKILELVMEETFNSYAKNVRHLRRNSPLSGFATFGSIGGRLSIKLPKFAPKRT